MSKKSAPAPDYRGAAEEQGVAQQQLLEQQTRANRPSQFTPWGSSTWREGPGGRWTQNIDLSPQQQEALDAQMAVQQGRSELAQGLISRTGQELEDPFAWQNMPEYGGAPTPTTMGDVPVDSTVPVEGIDSAAIRNRLPAMAETPEVQDVQTGLDFTGTQALDATGGYNPDFAQVQFDRQMSLMGPRMEQEREAMDARLRNQGLRPGTEAYNQQMQDLRDQQGERMARMSQDAMALGASEQQREFGRELATRQQEVSEIGTQGDFYNRALQQRFGQGMDIAGQSLAERAQRAQEEFGLEGMQSQRMQLAGQEAARAAESARLREGQAFQQQMQRANYQNALRQQAIAEEAQRRGMSINEMNALLTGQQVATPQMPGFTAAQQGQAPNYLGAAQAQGQFDLEQAAMNPWNQLISGVAGGFGQGFGQGIATG